MMAEARKPSQEEINRREKIHKLYNYYGIPYGIFDEDEVSRAIERDWNKAMLLIDQDKPVPRDLEERLLKHKKKAEKEVLQSARELLPLPSREQDISL